MTKRKPGAPPTETGKMAAPAEPSAAEPAPTLAAEELPGGAAETAEETGEAPDAGALVEPAVEAARRLELEAAQWKDRCLRAAAELENFKKRAVKERIEAGGRAQAELIQRTLDVMDDLGRVAALDPVQTTAQALHEGVGLVERKLLKAFEGVGLERVDPSGQRFDPNLHEAVMTLPAPGPEADHMVGTVLQLGYRLNGILLRPARVAVYAWSGPAAGGPVETPQ